MGTQKVIVQEFQQLAAGLPYKLIARTNNYSVLPSNLRHKFRYTLGTEVYGRENSRLITFEQSLPELAGKKLAMSFKPATQDDEDLIASYLPEPDPETGEIDPSQLPNTLPGYLINLTGEFTSNGEVIESAAAGTMGGELYETLALWSPNRGWRSAVNHPIAGEYRAIGLDLQGANAEDAARLLEQIEEIRAILESQEEEQLATLSNNDLIGDFLYATMYSYLSMNDAQDQVQSRGVGVVTYRMPSYGLFSTSLQTSYWFGIPRNVSFKGLNMDVDHLEAQVNAKSNDDAVRVGFLKIMGVRASALEHLIPEQMFSTDNAPAQGISAVKALAMASAQGQKIWTIDQSNLSAALASINLSDEVESEIRNAVSAGRIATAHQSPVAFGSGTNIGYILFDPVTGSGAYKIASGGNGSEINSNNLLIGSAGLLGITDGYTSAKLPGGKPWFSTVLKKIWNQGVLSKYTGYLGLGLSILSALYNDDLSVSDKVGQVSMNLLGFGIAAYVITSAASFALAPIAVLLVGLLVSIALAVAITYINANYFSSIRRKRRARGLIA